MKRKLLFAALCVAGALGGQLRAQTADQYFPSVFIQNVADVLTSTTPVADLEDFSPLTGDYTIEVAGTKDTEITFPYDRYSTVSYTPTVTGTIRFVHNKANSIVFVYEKESTTYVYKGKATISSVTWPAMETANVNDATNLLGNPDFQVYGDAIDAANNKYKLGEPWAISTEDIYGASKIRQGKNSNSHDNSGTTTDCFVWRIDGTAYNNQYFYQEVTLKPNGKYKYRTRISQNTNTSGTYSVSLGKTAGGDEYSKVSFTIANNATSQVKTGELTTPAELGAKSYFSVVNGTYNSSTHKACTQIDLFQLVEATNVATAITGVSTAVYVAGTAISPICDGNATAAIKNPYIESGTSNWTSGVTGTDNQYTDAPGGTYLNNWNVSSKDMYQVVTLPAGVYTIKAATRGSADLEVGFIYAQVGEETIAKADIDPLGDTNEGTLGKGWKWTEFNFLLVKGSSVKIGFYSECGSGKWAGADEFHLTYKGTTASANMTVKANKWGTFIAPFDVAIPTGIINAYKVTGTSGSGITTEEVTTTIPANTPVILENISGANYSENFEGTIVSANDLQEGLLTGVYSNAIVKVGTSPNDNYILQTQGGVQGFYKVDEAFTATPNRCYLTVTGGGVKAFFFGNDADGIKAMENGKWTIDNVPTFRLDGTRVNGKITKKGLYIQNGKKVVIK